MAISTAVEAIFEVVGRQDDPSVDLAMAAALPTADAEAVALSARALLRRGQPEGLLGLVRWYHCLAEPEQTEVLAQAHRLDRALREATGDNDEQVAANVLTIVRHAGPGPLTYLLTEHLRHGSSSTRRRAADALFDMAATAAAEPELDPAATEEGESEQVDAEAQPSPATDARAAHRFLLAALTQAVDHFGQHRQPAALFALLAMAPRPMAEAWQTLSAEHHPAVLALRQMLKSADQEPVRRALLPLVALPTLRGHAAGALSQVAGDQRLHDPLSLWHLLLLPGTRQSLSRLAPMAAMTPRPDETRGWPDVARRGMPHWVDVLPLTPFEKVDHLAAWRACDDAMVRLSALRRLIALSSSGAPGAAEAAATVARFCDDAEPAIAQIALRHLRRRRWPGLTQLLTKLVNSHHPQVRRLASGRLAPIGFDRLWKAWPKLEAGQRLAAGRALIKIDPRFHTHLAVKLRDGDDQNRLRALSIVTQLNQGSYFEDELIALAADEQQHVASAAVSALATVKSDRAAATLEWALDHDDARVRANAVESLEQLRSTRHVQQLLKMAQQDQNRPRANAIKALMGMRTADAMNALHAMLDDPSAGQRVSALWLIEELGLLDVARQVAELSVADDDRTVQARASRVMQYLIDQLKSGGPTTQGTAASA